MAVDAARELAAAWRKLENGELEDVRLQEDEVKRDPAMLGDALSARPLFGGRQIVQISLTGESLAKPLETILTAIDSNGLIVENYLILTSEALSPKSRLRSTLEPSPHVASLSFVADDQAMLGERVVEFLTTYKLSISPDALESFVEELPGDRRLANAEMEKLSLYALDLGRPISLDDIELVSSTERKLGAEDAADAALAGETRKAVSASDRFVEAGGSPISGLRTLHFRLLRVLDALAGERFLRPRVSDADKPKFNNMLKSWNAARIGRALTMLYAAELSCKQAGAPAEAIFKIVIDRISRRAV